jgi:hypothetical protein
VKTIKMVVKSRNCRLYKSAKKSDYLRLMMMPIC